MLAAVDIGSNAIRLLISEQKKKNDQAYFKKRALIRLPIRLGADVFSKQKISKKTLDKLILGLQSYKNIMKVYQVEKYRICATSAFREAANKQQAIQEIQKQTGLDIELISGAQEAALIHAQDAMRVFEEKKKAYMYVDVGGGSTEISLFKASKIEYSKSFKIGTVRILEGKDKKSEWKAFFEHIDKIAKKEQINGLIGTGGTINKYAKIITEEKKPTRVSSKAFLELYDKLLSMSYKQRMHIYDLNPDRADVIVPAGKIFSHIFNQTSAAFLYVPKVGLADGIIRQLAL